MTPDAQISETGRTARGQRAPVWASSSRHRGPDGPRRRDGLSGERCRCGRRRGQWGGLLPRPMLDRWPVLSPWALRGSTVPPILAPPLRRSPPERAPVPWVGGGLAEQREWSRGPGARRRLFPRCLGRPSLSRATRCGHVQPRGKRGRRQHWELYSKPCVFCPSLLGPLWDPPLGIRVPYRGPQLPGQAVLKS